MTYAVQNLTDYINNLGLVSDVATIKMQKSFVRTIGWLKKHSGISLTPWEYDKDTQYKLNQLDKLLAGKVNTYEKEKEAGYRRPTGVIKTGGVEDEDTVAGEIKYSKDSLWPYDANEFQRTIRTKLLIEESYGNKPDRTADARAAQEMYDKMMVGPELPDWRKEQIEYQRQLNEESIEGWKYLDEMMDESSSKQKEMWDRMGEDRLDMASGWANTMYGMMEASDYSFDKIGKEFDKMIKGMLVKAALTGIFTSSPAEPADFLAGSNPRSPGKRRADDRAEYALLGRRDGPDCVSSNGRDPSSGGQGRGGRRHVR